MKEMQNRETESWICLWPTSVVYPVNHSLCTRECVCGATVLFRCKEHSRASQFVRGSRLHRHITRPQFMYLRQFYHDHDDHCHSWCCRESWPPPSPLSVQFLSMVTSPLSSSAQLHCRQFVLIIRIKFPANLNLLKLIFNINYNAHILKECV